MSVKTLHPQYASELKLVTRVRDAVKGHFDDYQIAKKYLVDYIPKNDQKKEQLHKLGYYLNVVGRTRDDLLGKIFRKDEALELPKQLESMIENCNGSGDSIKQFARKVCDEAMQSTRLGVMADYPKAPDGLSKADVEALGLRPFIKLYSFESIINHSWRIVSGRKILDFVVLVEFVEKETIDEFTVEVKEQYRVLMINETGYYEQRLYDQQTQLIEQSEPKDADGNKYKLIPFYMIERETPILHSLANVNLAYYQATCDRMQANRIFSQISIHVDTGDMSNESFATANPDGVMFGGSAIQTQRGKVEILQANESNFGVKTIADLENQMAIVGGRITDQTASNQTAEAVRINASSETSVLSQMVGEVSETIEAALEFCASTVVGADGDEVQLQLNDNFFDLRLDAQTILAFIQLADRGDIAQSDIRSMLRKSGTLDESRTDDVIDDELSDQGV